MEEVPEQPKAVTGSTEPRAADELIKLIVKLRWMGLEDEADGIERQVSSLSVRAAECVVAAPHDTDEWCVSNIRIPLRHGTRRHQAFVRERDDLKRIRVPGEEQVDVEEWSRLSAPRSGGRRLGARDISRISRGALFDGSLPRKGRGRSEQDECALIPAGATIEES